MSKADKSVWRMSLPEAIEQTWFSIERDPLTVCGQAALMEDVLLINIGGLLE